MNYGRSAPPRLIFWSSSARIRVGRDGRAYALDGDQFKKVLKYDLYQSGSVTLTGWKDLFFIQ